jgi:ribosomal protein S18 acetylase RimI-like enzyme
MQACYPPVYAHLWPDGGKWYLNETYREEAVLKDLAEADAPYWIVQWEGSPVGILRWHRHQPCPDYPEVAGLKLHRIYLHLRTHGLGIGRQLMALADAEAHCLGKALVWLEAMDTQQAAQGFYEKMGYQVTGTFRLSFSRMPEHYRGMVRMTKRLSF